MNPADTGFIIVSAALVFIMTPGLAFFYGGLVRSKHVLSIMMQNLISMGIVTCVWIVIGFSMAFGPDMGGFIGSGFYALMRNIGIEPHPSYGPTIPFVVFFSYQSMFAMITPALITGAFADRVNFKSYLIFLIVWVLAVYFPVAHWVWGGGFLARWGVADFAGGLVVHLSAGMAALASVFVVGSRRFREGETPTPHNVGYIALGTGLLWFGWFGFNAGSALAANAVAGTAFVNTDIAASVAMVVWLLLSWRFDRKPSVVGALTGAIAGLAAVTPAAGFVRPWSAAVIGLAAGFLCYLAMRVRIRLRWDDALDVWSVHGVGGGMGTILTGVFAVAAVNGLSGAIEGVGRQVLVQLAAVVIVGAYAFAVTFVALKIINVFTSVRVSPEIEEAGLDEALHGEKGYTLG